MVDINRTKTDGKIIMVEDYLNPRHVCDEKEEDRTCALITVIPCKHDQMTVQSVEKMGLIEWKGLRQPYHLWNVLYDIDELYNPSVVT